MDDFLYQIMVIFYYKDIKEEFGFAPFISPPFNPV